MNIPCNFLIKCFIIDSSFIFSAIILHNQIIENIKTVRNGSKNYINDSKDIVLLEITYFVIFGLQVFLQALAGSYPENTGQIRHAGNQIQTGGYRNSLNIGGFEYEKEVCQYFSNDIFSRCHAGRLRKF